MKIKTLLLFFLLGIGNIGFAQNTSASVSDVVRETQVWSKEAKKMKLIWWIPTEYWEIATRDEPTITPQVLEQITSAVDHYTLVAALNVEIGALGFIPGDSIVVSLLDSEGRAYFPIAKDSINSETQILLDVLKPWIAGSLGNFGQSIEFYVFPRNDASGNQIANPISDKSFSVVLNESKFDWDLPLSTFIPPILCPEGNEELNGKWNYCPMHGVKLKPTPDKE